MAKITQYHTVQQGEDIIKISHIYGVHWQAIWDDPANEGLKQQRPTSGILYPGDVLTIPPSDTIQGQGATDQKHTFRAPRAQAVIELKLLDQGQPLAGLPAKLLIQKPVLSVLNRRDADSSTAETSANEPFVSITDGAGVVKFKIPAIAEEALLAVGDQPEQLYIWHLDIGELDPADTATGIQQRLHNLGMQPGLIDQQPDIVTGYAATLHTALTIGTEDTPDPETLSQQLTDHYGW